MKTGNYILWLPSWYPNDREPFNGDFIQRHAKAASLNNKITVIFFTQYGEKVRQEFRTVSAAHGNLEEQIVYVPFNPLGIPFIDRISYNVQFYRFSTRFLRSHFDEQGLPSLVHVHIPVKAGNLALWIKKKFSIPYIVSEHSSTYVEEAGDDFFQRRHLLYRLSVERIFSKAVAVTNVSRAIGEILQRLFKIKQLFVIPNVVDTDIFRPADLPKPVFTYIHVSSLTSQKNVFGILRVFRRMASLRTDWKLLIVGPYNSQIESFITNQNLENLIVLTGEVPYETVADHMNRSNALVLFSKHENFPCVVIESLCCGTPVVASDVAGIKEGIDESNGILVESEDEQQLLTALLRVREEFDRFDRWSIAASASSRFGMVPISKNFDHLYKQVLT